MTRPLTAREREVLEVMILQGIPDDPITPRDRKHLLELVPGVTTSRSCGCGSCPSIELESPAPSSGTGRVVLSGWIDGAMLMLFIDDDLPSYLELAPLDDAAFSVFPPAGQISFEMDPEDE